MICFVFLYGLYWSCLCGCFDASFFLFIWFLTKQTRKQTSQVVVFLSFSLCLFLACVTNKWSFDVCVVLLIVLLVRMLASLLAVWWTQNGIKIGGRLIMHYSQRVCKLSRTWICIYYLSLMSCFVQSVNIFHSLVFFLQWNKIVLKEESS